MSKIKKPAMWLKKKQQKGLKEELQDKIFARA